MVNMIRNSWFSWLKPHIFNDVELPKMTIFVRFCVYFKWVKCKYLCHKLILFALNKAVFIQQHIILTSIIKHMDTRINVAASQFILYTPKCQQISLQREYRIKGKKQILKVILCLSFVTSDSNSNGNGIKWRRRRKWW